ncbi:DUF2795 domain-containing protein [Actinoallomurus soli]|uniref:DUF2795 domain-containing protein n=1 Tax=Actinoallomurus soli TaxID=2952535 RepID=UPI002091FEAC|nr:DUF2795 domain-containing protein [Actinoallomurus soli]MCO5971682.1 DUF2795 domain-containing protein [Actinoallomurus soli]
MAQDFIEVQKYLSGIDYPASKEQLLEHAEKKGAPKEVLDDLKKIPEEEYDGPNRVSKAVSKT